MGSLSMYVAEDIEELRVLYKKVLRGISSSYLKYEASRVKGEEVIFQEFIKGQEYGLDVVNDLEGKYVATLGKKKMAMRAGETDSAVTMKSEELEMLGKTVSEALGHVGVLDVDVIKDNSTGKNYLIEMNARFGGGYPFSHNAGADVPLAIIKWLSGKEADNALFEIREGVKAQKELVIAEI
jgi:carbamoyl-phosphate synthase large subunit